MSQAVLDDIDHPDEEEIVQTYDEWTDGHRKKQGRAILTHVASRRFGAENGHRDHQRAGSLKRRLCDCAWWVQFKDGRSAVFLFEFQSSVDPGMALRTLRYSEAALSLLYGNETLRDPDGGLPLVLSFVVHTGPQRWSAANTVSALAARRDLPAESVTSTRCLTCSGRSRKTCCRRRAC